MSDYEKSDQSSIVLKTKCRDGFRFYDLEFRDSPGGQFTQ